MKWDRAKFKTMYLWFLVGLRVARVVGTSGMSISYVIVAGFFHLGLQKSS